jgi:hypothetical protein
MSEAIGRISHGDDDLATVALLSFEPIGLLADPIGYKGSFILSEGTLRPTVDELYTLALADGRSGKIRIERVTIGTHQDTLVFFRTSGPFA